MYNSSYEEYMQNVLGYNMRPQNTYQDMGNIYEMQQGNEFEDMSLEALYPETYRMIYPMVQKVCMRATGVINEELISDMTNEVYNAMEERETRQSKEISKSSSEIRSGSLQSAKRVEETRQNNFMLRDLIRILIIRELLRRRRRPGRPPMRPAMRPPYPVM